MSIWILGIFLDDVHRDILWKMLTQFCPNKKHKETYITYRFLSEANSKSETESIFDTSKH